MISPFSYSVLEASDPPNARINYQVISPSSLTSSPVPPEDRPSPPRWNTYEFYFYFIIFLICVPLMLKAGYNLSTESHPNYHLFEPFLQPGWMFGRKVDNSDIQYRSFREQIPMLFGVVILHTFLRHGFNKLTVPSSTSDQVKYRVLFDVFFSMIFLFVLHGFSLLKIVGIIGTNFLIAKSCGGHVSGPVLTWIIDIGFLFLAEWYDGFLFKSVGLPILDSFSGMSFRWQIYFNITMLRLISFNMDYFWSQRDATTLEKNLLDQEQISERTRIASSCLPSEYTFLNFLAYATYTPLYVAGPIMTFNNWISQLKYPSSTLTIQRTVLYSIRLGTSLLCMETLLHFYYVVAISKAQAWSNDSPFEISMIGYYNLVIIWLKLLIPWRFFRLWAMIDKIEAPENMLRCMSNSYSASGFWRSWHRSFNRWILRYIYIPLGGSKRSIPNTFIVFTFVALWHDLSFKLLTWGWLIALFIIPELVATALFPAKIWAEIPWYRHLCAVGAVLNLVIMMVANLIGFCLGVDGMKSMLKEILSSWRGIGFFVSALGALFVGVQVMFEYREEEKRKGIYLKC